MTTGAMNCERFNEQLMDYLEHDVDAATRASVEHHAVTCDECGTLLADLRKLRVDAASLPELTPSRDLWSGIATRIETPVVPIGGVGGSADAASGAARRRPRRWVNAGLIAASLVAAAMLGYSARGVERQVAQQQPAPASPETERPAAGPDSAPSVLAQTTPGSPAAPDTRVTPNGGAAAAPVSAAGAAVAASARSAEVQLAVARLTADYDREIARLRTLIEQRRSQLDPATIGVIERNLAVIDTAIAESRRAIADDPSSRFLIEFLNQSLQDKVELMRTAALLPSRT